MVSPTIFCNNAAMMEVPMFVNILDIIHDNISDKMSVHMFLWPMITLVLIKGPQNAKLFS